MFTGLIEEVGVIKAITYSEKGARIIISCSKILKGIALGDSISTNGVCLTATKINGDTFEADVMAETMRNSNLSIIKAGDKVNLERALTLSQRLGGHLVSGHIDGTGIITSLEKEDNAVWVTVTAERDLLKYIILKGSIAIDGISLTVAYVDDEKFKVSIIPHTGSETTLLSKKIGDDVNLEGDIIGKYVERLLGFNSNKSNEKTDISLEFLKDNGFI